VRASVTITEWQVATIQITFWRNAVVARGAAKKDAESNYCQPSSDDSGPERDQVTQESKSVGLIYGQE